jgi:two-component system phosphate regulon response regulator PhoB
VHLADLLVTIAARVNMPPDTTETTPRRKQVLVVEDQADLRKLISLTLGTQGYTLAEAATAAQASALLDAESPDVVLLDVMLPGDMSGLDLCRRIKDDPRLCHTQVIVMTAADQAEQRQRALQAGADHYVAKPFSPRVLRELVASLLARPVADRDEHG